MKNRTKRLLLVAIALTLVCCSIAGWAAFKAVAWARDLPNRIVVDGDELANALGAAVTQSYHQGLINGDAQMQIQIIRDFSKLVSSDAEAREWIRTEYSSDIQQLSSSANAEVALLAAELLTFLAEPPDPVQRQSAGKTSE